MSPALTVWSTQTDSAPLWFVYCACAMALIARTSAALAGVDAFAGVAFGQHSFASCVLAPMKVEVETLSQSTWNL